MSAAGRCTFYGRRFCFLHNGSQKFCAMYVGRLDNSFNSFSFQSSSSVNSIRRRRRRQLSTKNLCISFFNAGVSFVLFPFLTISFVRIFRANIFLHLRIKPKYIKFIGFASMPFVRITDVSIVLQTRLNYRSLHHNS